MEQHIYHRMREIEDAHWWFAGRRAIVRQALMSLNLPRAANILDVGCGTGGNLGLLAQFGNAHGVELDDGAAALARERGIGQIKKGALPDAIPFAGKSFDLAVMLDVLEHIDDDEASLAALGRLLKPRGYLLITVPAFMFLWGPHDVEHHHKRRYVARRLRACLEGAGFEVEHLSYYNSLLFPAVAAVRVLERFLPSRSSAADLRMPGKVTNKLLRGILSSERHIVSRMRIPFGISLIAIARKKCS